MAYTSPSVTASGTTFAQLQVLGLKGALAKMVAAQVATAAPTSAPTANATAGGASGGALAEGTYYFVSTETNGRGETKAGPQGNQLTISATNIPRFTFPTLKAGNTARNLYLGAAGGSTGGPYTRYAAGITTSTYDAAVAAPATSDAVAPPTFNSTGLTWVDANGNTQNRTLALLDLLVRGDAQPTLRLLDEITTNFLEGDPTPYPSVLTKLRHAHTVIAMLAALCAEVGVIVDANPGTIALAATGIGGAATKRVWA